MATVENDVSLNPPQDGFDFFNYEIEEAEERLGTFIGKRYHGTSAVRFVYKFGISDVDAMSSLSHSARKELKPFLNLDPLPIKKRFDSKDGTVKFIFEIETKNGTEEIESVYIPDEKRVTLCVSSQAGCKMGCKFCLTAQLGFRAHLSASQIVRQIWTVSQQKDLRPLTNLVFMGMGEPLDNEVELKRAIKILTHQRGFDFSARKITVSTVGMVDRIDAIAKEDPFRLAVSLNSTDDKIRSDIMPINRKWNLDELLSACHRYSKRTNKRITFEYVMMKGITDRAEDLLWLKKHLSQLPCKLNLIPYNENAYTSYKRPNDETVMHFHGQLLKAPIPVFIRKNRGNDIYAACGMLRKERASLEH